MDNTADGGAGARAAVAALTKAKEAMGDGGSHAKAAAAAKGVARRMLKVEASGAGAPVERSPSDSWDQKNGPSKEISMATEPPPIAGMGSLSKRGAPPERGGQGLCGQNALGQRTQRG